MDNDRAYLSQRALDQWADHYAKATDVDSTVLEEWLIFHVAGQRLALPMAVLARVEKPGQGMAPPHRPPALIGAMLVNGKPIPLWDLAWLMDLTSSHPARQDDQRLLFLEEGHHGETMAFLVDRMESGWIHLPPLPKTGTIEAPLVVTWVEQAAKPVGLLNPTRLLRMAQQRLRSL